MERVESAVIAEAESRARALVEEARREGEARLAQAREAAQQDLDEALRAAEARAERETARQLGRARHEGRLDVLAAKNEVLDGVFASAKETLASMGDSERAALMAGRLSALAGDIGGALRVNPRDKGLVSRELLDRVNAGRPEGGRFTGVIEDPRVPDGAVVEAEEYTVDLTLTSKLDQLREALSAELTREIFPQ